MASHPGPSNLLLANLRLRHLLVAAVRRFFEAQGFIEVETPLLLPTVAPEEQITPIRCGDRFLATSPELEMKRLVAAGLGPVYQLTRSFRTGESGRRHNPEFTILEWYRPGDSIVPLVADLEGLLGAVAAALGHPGELTWQGRRVELAPPWPVTSVSEAFRRHAGWDPAAHFEADRFDLDLVDKVEPNLGRGIPEALAFYPAAAASLARLLPADSRLAQRVELYVEGMELANGFVELNDPAEQRARFLAAAAAIRAAGREPPPLPEDYLAELPRLPDTTGIALGIDRLVMLFADADDIGQVRAFCHRD